MEAIENPKRVKAILLAAGRGTRLQPLTNSVPKCLLELDGHRLLDFWISNLVNAGVEEVVVNTHHLHETVREYLLQVNSNEKINLIESFEPVLLGSAYERHAKTSGNVQTGVLNLTQSHVAWGGSLRLKRLPLVVRSWADGIAVILHAYIKKLRF